MGATVAPYTTCELQKLDRQIDPENPQRTPTTTDFDDMATQIDMMKFVTW
jgi:hypothetical protein